MEAVRVIAAGTMLAVTTMITLPAAAQEAGSAKGMVRSTVIGVFTDTKSNALDLDAKRDFGVAVDLTYFPIPNIGVNLLATFLSPEVEAGGASLGSVKLLPPILTVQWHFLPEAGVQPYLGAGVNANIFYDESGTLETINADVKSKIGLIGQFGADFMLPGGVWLNLDLKYLRLRTDVETDLGNSELPVDAAIVGAGVGYRF